MKKIIVVDDEQDILYTTKKVIEYYDKDYKITTLDCGKKLFELLVEDTPDLILLEITMPNMNGWDIHKKLKSKSEWKDIPIIFISSVVDDKSIRKAKEIGDDFIEKPFTPDILLDKIENILK